jgi:hypothetical protein
MDGFQQMRANLKMRDEFGDVADECLDATDHPPAGFCAWPYNGSWRKDVDGRYASGQFARRWEM